MHLAHVALIHSDLVVLAEEVLDVPHVGHIAQPLLGGWHFLWDGSIR